MGTVERGSGSRVTVEQVHLQRERARSNRIERLQQATARLAAALTVQEVSDALLAVTEDVLESSSGVVYLDEGTGTLHLAAWRGVAPSVQQGSLLPRDSGWPLSAAVSTRAAIFIRDRDELLRQYPGMAEVEIPASQLRAVAALPLIHLGRVVGALGVSFDADRAFDDDERRWLISIASQAAVAADRARLYQAEQQARREAQAAQREAERARDEAETLYRLAESLSASQMDLESIVQRVTDEATRLTGAEFGAFFYNVIDDGGEAYLLYTLSGAPKESFAKLGLPRNTPIFAATFGGEAVVRLDDVKKDPRYGTMAPHHGMPKGHLPVTSYLAVPVISRSGEVLGGLFFGHSLPARFTEQHERVTRSLAATAALTLDNAKLYRTTRDAQEKQRRLVESQAETIRLNELFMGVLAHDLRTPLTAVLTAAELVRSRLAPEGGRNLKAVDRIVTSGQRMSRMIEQLLDYTRLRVGTGMVLEPRGADLGTLLSQAVEELQQGHPEAIVGVEQTGNLEGRWDVDRLGQVFSNLLGNAIQHGTRGTVHVVADGTAADRVQVRVHNQGAIPPQLLSRVFEPLIGSARGKERAGLGLGLFITREIVAAHAGHVSVTSSDGEGTTFTATLPRITEVQAGRPTAPGDSPAAPAAISAPPEDLRQSEARFRLLVESVKDYAIFMLDPQGRVQTWNVGAKRIKGYDAAEIIGQHFSRFYEEQDIQAGKCEMELEVAARDGRFEDDGWRVRKDGTRFWANVVITALRGTNGELVGFAKVTRDLTERRALEDERVGRVRAEEALRLRDDFLALASHELKTPLTVMQMQLDSLHQRLGNSDEKVSLKLFRAARSTERLARLVESLLDVSHLTTGKLSLVKEQVDLGAVVSRVLDDLEPAATRAGCELRITIDSGVVGSWDPLRLEQAVSHLLSNAIKYGAGKPIAITARLQGDEAVLEIRDHGPGIAEGDRGRLFRRFERAVSLRNYGGLGLGLFLVQEIVEAHGGTVLAENAEGGGERLQLRLPRAAVSND